MLRVLTIYDRARAWAAAHPQELRAMLVGAMKLPDPVIARQLERTDLSDGRIGGAQAVTIIEAGRALQAAGVLDTGVDVAAMTNALIDPSYITRLRA